MPFQELFILQFSPFLPFAALPPVASRVPSPVTISVELSGSESPGSPPDVSEAAPPFNVSVFPLAM